VPVPGVGEGVGVSVAVGVPEFSVSVGEAVPVASPCPGSWVASPIVRPVSATISSRIAGSSGRKATTGQGL